LTGKNGKWTARRLAIVFGDQLDGESAIFDGFDPEHDAILMMEVREEASYIPQHKLRLAFFFAAMRHFRDAQRARGRRVFYSELDHPENRGDFEGEIARWAQRTQPEALVAVKPGDFRVLEMLRATANKLGLPLDIRPDRHFLCSDDEFSALAADHPKLILETFYRFMRRKLGILLAATGQPQGGTWNFDKQNRAALDAKAPRIAAPRRFPPDATTQAVLATVARQFPGSPGSLKDFAFPVTREQALLALDDFVENRLASFGRYQDAMRTGESVLFHSHLSGPLNLHLLRPVEVVERCLGALERAPLASVEGYIRQIIGWREFVRGVYWRHMPGYASLNALGAALPAPRLLWTGETEMRCMAEAIGNTIEHAYAHHIQRLMVLGQFCLLLGVRPYDVHRWHMSMFWDAIDWVSLPNALGMSQYGDGGIMGTKPYCASGNYINRMSDYCRHCRYDPAKAAGEDACPFTTLYWDFLARNRQLLARNPRLRYPYMNLDRKHAADVTAIRRRAGEIKLACPSQTFL
jgi:deoxyribodipyrimidine photolyase-related protein